MPTKKKAKTKKNLTLKRRLTRSNLIAVAAAAALFGILIYFGSQASGVLDVPTSVGELVMEYRTPLPHAVGFDGKPVAASGQPARLYGDGTLICGSDTSPSGFKSTKLSAAQISSFVSQLSATGLLQLKDKYNDKPYQIPDNELSVALNLVRGAKKVGYFSGPKPPAAFDKAIALVNGLCQQAKSAYVPTQATVDVFTTDSTAAKKWNSDDSLFPEIKNGAGSKALNGTQVKAILDQIGQQNTVLSRQGRNYQINFSAKLPPAAALRFKKAANQKTSVNTLVPDAHAEVAARFPINVYWYNGGAHAGQVQDIAQNMLSFWASRVGKNVAWSANQLGGGYPGGNMGQVYNYLWNNYFTPGQSRVFLLEANDTNYPNGYCSGLGGFQNATGNWDDFGGDQGGIAVVMGFGNGCQKYYQRYSFPAHETGHSFSLDHQYDGGIMDDHAHACDTNWGGCGVTPFQAQGLNASSPFFNDPPPLPAGPIRDKWYALGGPGWCGNPTTGVQNTPNLPGQYVHFANGCSIYYSDATGAHAIYGDIRNRWSQLGWENWCGFPTTDESPANGGRYNHFQNGCSIYWSPNTGSHNIAGADRSKWASLGWENWCGFPINNESPTPNKPGYFIHFQNGCSIYYSGATGSHEVHGSIRNQWASLGWENGSLGFPTSDEHDYSDGTGSFRRNDFQNGAILWNKANYAITVLPPGVKDARETGHTAKTVSLAWSAPPNTQSYQIWNVDSNGWHHLFDTSSTSFTVTGLTQHTQYNLNVVGVSQGHVTQLSNWVQGTTNYCLGYIDTPLCN